jgi:hydroxymethylpyrimidine/phosphomethylpyrimidine kinase
MPGPILAKKQHRVKSSSPIGRRRQAIALADVFAGPGSAANHRHTHVLHKSNKRSAGPALPGVLLVAGSDSGGGAGIQADLATCAAFGVHATCAITAVTAQDTRGVAAIEVLSARMVRAQSETVLDDFRIGVVKTGMLATPALVRVVAAALARRPRLRLVLDPVLVATTGATLGDARLADAIRRHLLARAELVTPNWPEALRLLDLGAGALDPGDARHDAACRLRAAGADAVLVKGGHLGGRRVEDLLLDASGVHRHEHPRIPGEGHGTGCTLATAAACALARGFDRGDAVAIAIDYVQRALTAGYRPGRGALRVLDHSVRPALSQAAVRRLRAGGSTRR